MIEEIYIAKSCAEKSRAVLKVLYNKDIDTYGVELRDDDGDRVLIAIDADTACELAETIIRTASGGSA